MIIRYVDGDVLLSSIQAISTTILILNLIYFKIKKNIELSSIIFLFVMLVVLILFVYKGPLTGMWVLAYPLATSYLIGKKKGFIINSFFFISICIILFIITPDSTNFDFNLRLAPLLFLITSVSYFFEFNRESTEKNLERNEKYLRIQRDISLVANQKISKEEILSKILKIILEIKYFDSGGIYIINKNEDLELISHTGLSNEFINKIKLFPKNSRNTKIVNKAKTIFLNSKEINNNTNKDLYQKENLKNISFSPILFNGKVIASLNLGSKKYNYIDKLLQNFIVSVSSELGIIIEQQNSKENIQALTQRNDDILGSIPDIIIELDNNNNFTWSNKAGYDFFGDDIIGKSCLKFLFKEEKSQTTTSPILSSDSDTYYIESWQYNKNKEIRYLAWWNKILKDKNNKQIGILSTARDITEKKQMESDLKQAQKMEAIGQLAGGIAHDFNNQLAAIFGFSELIKRKSDDDSDFHKYSSQILATAKRASDLTGQLLAFARKGKYTMEDINIDEIILEVVSMLTHTIDKKITVSHSLKAIPAQTFGDSTQLQNALLNIALNAKDALPNGGDIIFATEIRELDQNYCNAQQYKIEPGKYIEICIVDTGSGIKEDTIKRIFEPFFTTKPKGKGTGMGLAAVYGIIKSHLGAINVFSTIDKGTTFKIYLPLKLATIEKETNLIETSNLDNTTNSEDSKNLNIIIVDDEMTIRITLKEMLISLGHSITLFKDGKEALDFYKDNAKNVDIVILDMIMPIMGGAETFLEMQKINPDIKAIISSGYSINKDVQKTLDAGGKAFIQKPFALNDLTEVIDSIEE